ncbi:MAG: right-handed parallel beta-helix repeat-containing protein, partial [Pirellulales bacterium]
MAITTGLLGAVSLPAAEYYVAIDGIDGNPGTIDLPFASIARGQQAAAAGDTVWLRGGVYEFNAGLGASANAVYFNKSGAPGQRINYWAYSDETPVFDFFNYLPVERIRGFRVDADWLHFKGLELRGVQQTIPNVNESWAIRVEGSGGDFNIFEQLDLHHNEGPGLFIANGGNNLVLNSDSHHNYDPDRGGENADGFGSHSNDEGNVFIGNRAWHNSDDGFDFINSPGTVVLENSWAWHNGYIPDTNTAAGNGAGIKAGGFALDPSRFPDPEDVPRHTVRNSVAFDNRVQGFYANHHPGGIDWINNTAFDNSKGFDLRADVETATWPADHFLRNNISYGNNTNLANATQSDIDDE